MYTYLLFFFFNKLRQYILSLVESNLGKTFILFCSGPRKKKLFHLIQKLYECNKRNNNLIKIFFKILIRAFEDHWNLINLILSINSFCGDPVGLACDYCTNLI